MISAYLRLASVKARARPADFRLGQQIAALGEVEIIEQDVDRILAKVGRKDHKIQRRQIELRATAAGLVWRCTCTTKRDRFCKHCVAAALTFTAGAPALTITASEDSEGRKAFAPNRREETGEPR